MKLITQISGAQMLAVLKTGNVSGYKPTRNKNEKAATLRGLAILAFSKIEESYQKMIIKIEFVGDGETSTVIAYGTYEPAIKEFHAAYKIVTDELMTESLK